MGPDILISGYISKPASSLQNHQVIPFINSSEILSRISDAGEKNKSSTLPRRALPSRECFVREDKFGEISGSFKIKPAIRFFKTWDRYGALSNYSPHSIALPDAHGMLSLSSFPLPPQDR